MHELGGGGARSAPYKSQPEPPVGCALRTKDFDCAPAPWQLGTISYQPLAGGGLLLTHMRDGFGLLFEHEVGGGARQLANDYFRCRQLAVDGGFFYCIAGSPNRTAAVLMIDRGYGETSVLTGGEQPLLGTSFRARRVCISGLRNETGRTCARYSLDALLYLTNPVGLRGCYKNNKGHGDEPEYQPPA